MGTFGDVLFRGSLAGLAGAWLFFFFGQFFLNEDMWSKAESFWRWTYVCLFTMVIGTMLKYTGRLKLKYSKKKCIKCPKASAMGSIYCEFHRKMAARDHAFSADANVPGSADEEDENLGY